MPILDEYNNLPPGPLVFQRGLQPAMSTMTPFGVLMAQANQNAAKLSLARPEYFGGLLDNVLFGDVHAGLGKGGRYVGAGATLPSYNPFGLGGNLGFGAAADYNIDTGNFVPQATAKYATELGGGNLSLEANASPEGLGAFINWMTNF